MRMSAEEWNRLNRDDQVRGLAYERLRQREEQWHERRTPNVER